MAACRTRPVGHSSSHNPSKKLKSDALNPPVPFTTLCTCCACCRCCTSAASGTLSSGDPFLVGGERLIAREGGRAANALFDGGGANALMGELKELLLGGGGEMKELRGEGVKPGGGDKAERGRAGSAKPGGGDNDAVGGVIVIAGGDIVTFPTTDAAIGDPPPGGGGNSGANPLPLPLAGALDIVTDLCAAREPGLDAGAGAGKLD